MTGFVAALPMYDWPEARAEVDAQWAVIRDALRACGVEAPDELTRRNTASGDLDLAALWRHRQLLLAQTCWGPMEAGLSAHVRVVGQQDYDGIEGGRGQLYSSAIVMRRDAAGGDAGGGDAAPAVPLGLLRGRRFAFNGADSLSGVLALERDLGVLGESLALFPARIETGGHRASIRAVAEGRADVASIDCRSWAMARRFEPAARTLAVVGWTSPRKGLPFITAKETPDAVVEALKAALSGP